jgi:serine protease inhibitor
MGRFGRLAAGAVAILTLAACGASSSGSGDPGLIKAAGVQRADVRDAPVSAVAKGMTAFAYDLYRLGASSDTNAVLSPLSIATAFAMARAGARGATAAEIDKVFGLPPSGADEAFNAITQGVVTTDGPPPPRPRRRKPGQIYPPVVALANGLFVQDGFAIRDAYLRVLAAQYGTGVHMVDFPSGSGRGQINDWVRRRTAGLIPRLFDQLDPSTLLVLANALYLRADWAQPFAESPTTQQTFTRANGSTVRAPTMHQVGTLRYAAGNGWQAVELPYAGGDLAMRIVVPTGRTAPADLLAPNVQAAIAAGLRPSMVDLSVPRWKATTGVDLGAALPRLGMPTPFGPAADFSGIAAGLRIQQAVHRATITVDEWGTEAAAVTGLAFATSGMAPGAAVIVRADHPFAFSIVQTRTGVPLFVGHVGDPTG